MSNKATQQESPGGPIVRADGTPVRFRHVRAHAGHGMNERADRLAAQGAQGMHSRGGRIYVPTDGDGPGRRHGSGVYAPPGGPGDLPVDSVRAGLRAGGGRAGRGGEGGRRVVEVVGEPVGKRSSIS